MERIVSNWEHSGLSQQDYAQSQGVGLSKFKYWLYRLREEKAEPTTIDFTPIEISDTHSDLEALAIVRFPNGVSLELTTTFLNAQFIQILKAS